MTCKKSELISAINSFGSARTTGDAKLIAFAGELLVQLLETIEFEHEELEETVNTKTEGVE
jgi:hypothetical protein